MGSSKSVFALFILIIVILIIVFGNLGLFAYKEFRIEERPSCVFEVEMSNLTNPNDVYCLTQKLRPFSFEKTVKIREYDSNTGFYSYRNITCDTDFDTIPVVIQRENNWSMTFYYTERSCFETTDKLNVTQCSINYTKSDYKLDCQMIGYCIFPEKLLFSCPVA